MGLFGRKKPPFKEITNVPVVREEEVEQTTSNLPSFGNESVDDIQKLTQRVEGLEDWCKKFKDYVDSKLG